MIFFVANDGTVINSVPSPVYQGAADTNNIYLIAPFAENLQASVAFILPNGIYTQRYPMTFVSHLSGIIDKQSGQTYNGWQLSIPNEITKYFGTVTAQFFFYAAQSGVITPTSSTTFVVGKGVPDGLTPPPQTDIYNAILHNISLLSEQLHNGEYAARAIYQWNSTYTYDAGEITYYAGFGTYGAFVKSLKDNNTTEPFTNGVLNSDSWLLVSDFNILNELYGLQKELEEAVSQSQASATAAANSASEAQSAQTAAQQSAQTAQEAAESVKDSADYIEGLKDGSIAVTKALNDGNGKNIAEQFADIDSVIPSTASPTNELADKEFVNSSINNMAAFYITSNAAGDAFPTRASLLNATTYYYGGQPRTPTQNDYAIVLADESQSQGADGKYPTTRYSYQGTEWSFQYVVNNTSLTQEQVNAINSGITAQKIASMDAATAAKYTKPTTGIPESDLSANVQSKLNAGSSAPVKNLYNLGAFDSYTSDGNERGTVTRATIFISKNNITKYGLNGSEPYANFYINSDALKCSTGILKINGYIASYYEFNKLSGSMSFTTNSPMTNAQLAELIENLVIEAQADEAHTFTEQVIENQPIRPANQEEEYYWQGEWRKGLNLWKPEWTTRTTFTTTGNTSFSLEFRISKNPNGYENSITNFPYMDSTGRYFSIVNVPTSGIYYARYGYNGNVADDKIVVQIYLEQGIYMLSVDIATNQPNNLVINNTIMLNKSTTPYPYEPYYGEIARKSELREPKVMVTFRHRSNNSTYMFWVIDPTATAAELEAKIESAWANTSGEVFTFSAYGFEIFFTEGVVRPENGLTIEYDRDAGQLVNSNEDYVLANITQIT